MSIDQLREIVSQAGYRPRILNWDVRGSGLFGALSLEARSFLHAYTGKYDTGSPTVGQLYNKRICDDALLQKFFFEGISAENRTEVLCFLTLPLHELLHHVDFMSTPFGVNFHLKSFQEYLAFQSVAPAMLANPHLVPNGRLVDIQRNSPEASATLEHLVPTMWLSLLGKIRVLETWGDGGAVFPHQKKIEEGWGDGKSSARLLGQDLVRVTINAVLYTVELPSRKDWYLRPLTIFETRALANSLLWIRRLVGDHASLNQLVLDYVKTFYARNVQEPDYFFVPDIIARGLHYETFEQFLAESNPIAINQALLIMSAACWYALHALPPREGDSIFASNPVARLIFALAQFASWLRTEKPTPHASLDAALASMDNTDVARRLGLCSPGDAMSYCRDLIAQLRVINREQTIRPEMRDYFEHLFSLLQQQMDDRPSAGYASGIGMPLSGNPLMGMTTDASLKLFDHYVASETVSNWFKFRTAFIWSPMTQKRALEEIDAHFGEVELLVFCPNGHSFESSVPRGQQTVRETCPACGQVVEADMGAVPRIDVSEQKT